MMKHLERNFTDFNVGNLATLERTFSHEDYELFAKLSGDLNPLHFNPDYAQKSDFGYPIVPIHLAIAPLSSIAGMIFPGDPSLYLSHSIRSLLPVYYGDNLTYSARITSINRALRTLSIRVLVLREVDVVIDAEMQVMSRLESWTVLDDLPNFSPPRGTALITGSTGEIGTAIAMNLAKRGFDLILADRGPNDKRHILAESIRPLLTSVQRIEHITADLIDQTQIDSLCTRLSNQCDVTAVFHVASPPLDAPLLELVRVNYEALRMISSSVIPGMLSKQSGVISLISSVSTERIIPGWHNYSAAKAMAGQYLTSLDKTYGDYGLHGLVVLSGLVDTHYSSTVQGDAVATMIPQELAEKVVNCAIDDQLGNAVIIEHGDIRTGLLGFSSAKSTVNTPNSDGDQLASRNSRTEVVSTNLNDLEARIAKVLSKCLNIPSNHSFVGDGVSITPGWDSLRHMQIMLDLESAFNISFSADEISTMLTYDSIYSIICARTKSF